MVYFWDICAEPHAMTARTPVLGDKMNFGVGFAGCMADGSRAGTSLEL